MGNESVLIKTDSSSLSETFWSAVFLCSALFYEDTGVASS